MSKYAAILRNLAPLPRTWGERHVHDSQPANAAEWRKHLRQLEKAKAQPTDIAPSKKLRVVKSTKQKKAS